MKNSQDIDFDFKSKINNVSQKVNNISLFRLSFITILLGTTLSLGNSVSQFIFHNISDHQTQNEQSSLIEKTKRESYQQSLIIPDNEIPFIIAFLHKNLTNYDRKVEFVKKINVNSKIEFNKYDTLELSYNNYLNNELFDHKELVTKYINTIYDVQNKLKLKIDVKDDDIELFNKIKNLYLSKTFIHSKDLDERLNGMLYNPSEGNRYYINKYHIFNVINNLDAEFNH